MDRRLTAKQQKFINGVIDGLSLSEAYRRAGYAVKNMTNGQIAVEACHLSAKPNITLMIAQGREEVANKAIWGREQALQMLVDIANTGKTHMVYKKTTKKIDENGEENEETVEMFDAAAANSAAKAIEQANKMCGYNEPDKVDVSSSGFEVIISNATDKN